MREIRPFFTSIYHKQISINQQAIVDYVNDLKSFNETLHNSNAGGWHSETWESLDNQPDCIVEIMNTIHEDMIELYSKYNISKEPELENYWFISNGKYSYNRLHTHPGAFLSGVIYIKVPNNCGKIIFKRPDYLIENFDGFISSNNEYNYGNWEIPPEVGKIVYFSSAIPHEVAQNLTEDEDDQRICLSFNYR